ncbi:MAG TPA: hypothetical protein VE178_01565 [Silvibacterium sp.]|nr:hypothetical protein [Silvibacterium sp.]
MKRIATVKSGVILFTILTASIPVFAGNVSSTSLHLATPTQVGASDLPAGDYKVTWADSASSDAATQVNFVQGKKVIATVPAKLARATNNGPSFETNTLRNGTIILQEIRVSHANLSFENTATAQR